MGNLINHILTMNGSNHRLRNEAYMATREILTYLLILLLLKHNFFVNQTT